MIDRIGGQRHGGAESSHRHPRGIAPLLLGCTFIALLAFAPAAIAAKQYSVVTQFPPNCCSKAWEEWNPREFGFLAPDSVAVSDKNDHIYVADSGRGAIFDYSSTVDKTPTRWNGTNTGSGSFGGGVVGVAADNSTGDVYVADSNDKVIDKFDENGNLINSFGDTTPTANGQLAGLKTPAGSFSPSTGSYSGFGIAVDQATHNVYVLDAGHEVIDIFNEKGEYLSQITATPEGLYDGGGRYASGIAVSSTGNVYASSWEGPNRIFQFGPSNEYISTWDGGQLPNGAASETPDGNFSAPNSTGCCLVAAGVEDSTGNVFVADFHYALNVFDANGNFIPPQANRNTVGSQYFSYPDGVAVDQETGLVYVSEHGQVTVLRPVVVPDVSIASTSSIGTTTATLHGHVDPATGEGGGPVTNCHFEYLTVYEAARNFYLEPFNGAKSAPCSPAIPPDYPSPQDVSATVSGLTPGTEYRVRIIVENSEGESNAVGSNFITVGHYGYSTKFGTTGSGNGQLNEPEDVAVNEASGDIYVADAGNNRIDEFSSSGTFVRAFGANVGGSGVDVCTSACSAGSTGTAANDLNAPRFVEVDNSAGPSAGDVYEADGADHIVHKFSSAGSMITGWANGGAFEFVKKEGAIGGITVDEQGALYVVTDAIPYNWTLISGDTGTVTTAYPTNESWFGGERLGLGNPGFGGIEVGADGTWYEAQQPGDGRGVMYSSPLANEYDSFHMYPSLNLELENSGITFDRSDHDLFVDQGSHIDRFPGGTCSAGEGASGCQPADSFGTGDLGTGAGLAVRASNHTLYAADSKENDIAIFTRVPLPQVTTSGSTNVTPTAGTMNGHVDPGAGGTVDECKFEYVPGRISNEVQELSFSGAHEGEFSLSYEGQTTASIIYPPGNFGDSTIAYDLEHLPAIGSGNVSVTNAPGHAEEGPYYIEFTNRFQDLNVPQITVDGSSLLPGGANATISTKYPGNGWSYAQTAPCSPAAPLTSSTDVSASLTGLSTYTTYHYRLVAGRSDGDGFTEAGVERTFVPAPALPPEVNGSSSSDVKSSSVKLSAQINPKLAPTVYRFQYGPTTAYGSQTVLSEPIGEDETDHTVNQELTGLTPGTNYHFRVLAVNINGKTAGSDHSFVTPDRPGIDELTVSGITMSGATFSARISAGFLPTTYRFDYGPTAAFGSSTATGSLAEEDIAHQVSASISQLKPETTYFVRTVAENDTGAAESQVVTFTTKSEPSKEKENEKKKKKPCRKGYVRKHGKCIKKGPRHHHHRHHGRSHK